MMTIFFTRKNGKYLSDRDNHEVTTEMLMNNEHEINGDFGWIKVKAEIINPNTVNYNPYEERC